MAKRYAEKPKVSIKRKITATIIIAVLIMVLIIEASLSFFSDIVVNATNIILGNVNITMSNEEIDYEDEWNLGDTNYFRWTITNTGISKVQLSNTITPVWVDSSLSTANVIEIEAVNASVTPIILAPGESHAFEFRVIFEARIELSREYLLAFNGLDLELQIETRGILADGNDTWNDTETTTLTLKDAIVELDPLNEMDFEYTGERQIFVVPQTGRYFLEVWGADGGAVPNSIFNGRGGYSSGWVNLTAGETLYLYVGGRGEETEGANHINAGGFNGGGSARNSGTVISGIRAGGGGASDIRVVNDTLFNRIIVSGGGGGNSGHSANQVAGNGGDLVRRNW